MSDEEVQSLLCDMEEKMGTLPDPVHEPIRFDYYCRIYRYFYWKK